MSKNLNTSKSKSGKITPTGYWTFFCNPKKWAIDDFLESGIIEDAFIVNEWQKDWFNKGQLGVIRVGRDKRTLKQLAGKPRLKPGIYAIVEVLDKAEIKDKDRSKHWYDDGEKNQARYRVSIRYIKNLLNNPIILDDLSLSESNYDKYLIKGFQASTMPLNQTTFNHIASLVDGFNKTDIDLSNFKMNTDADLAELEKAYINAVPEVKKRVSQYIERGVIAQKFKIKTNFMCQICDAKNVNPYSFKKKNGEYYVETHHVMSVSTLSSGVLSTNN